MANIEKWVNELQSEIDDLKRAMLSPVPSGGVVVDDLGHAAEYATLTLPTGKKLTDYDYIYISMVGIYGDVFLSTLIRPRFDKKQAGTQLYFVGNGTYNFDVDVTSENDLLISQRTSEDIHGSEYYVQGIKLAPANNSRRENAITRATNAVKSAVKKATKTTRRTKK